MDVEFIIFNAVDVTVDEFSFKTDNWESLEFIEAIGVVGIAVSVSVTIEVFVEIVDMDGETVIEDEVADVVVVYVAVEVWYESSGVRCMNIVIITIVNNITKINNELM